MSVYVDDMRAAYGRMIMCHMIADTSEELHAMVDRIGVAPKWVQDAGTYREHYDIARSKRAKAIACGAVPISMRELASRIHARRPSEATREPFQEGDQAPTVDVTRPPAVAALLVEAKTVEKYHRHAAEDRGVTGACQFNSLRVFGRRP